MKILIATTPIRPTPTYFPPIGSLSLVKALRKAGFRDVEFYNIDGNRPSYKDAVEHIVAAAPDVIGISSVVSTAYAYTKQLSLDLKKLLPNSLIIVGGNLAASAEILLRKTGTDLCALGEGEKILVNVAKRAVTTRSPFDFKDIPGLTLLDVGGSLVNTGYEAPLANDEIYDFDWEDLEKSSDISIYIHPLFGKGSVYHPSFIMDSRTFEPHRRNKRFAMIPDGKGCVARCTFCHRWDKGIRYTPVERFIEQLDELIDKYNVGFISPATENFGSDRRWVESFCKEIKKRDVLFALGAVRTKTVSPEMIAKLKDAGCVSISYGMETGSPTILEVMEKKTSIKDNENAQRWTVDAGFSTVVQLVLGMPGESPKTIRETIDFCKFCFTLSPDLNPNNVSINYAQALPGTPLYEYGRHKGLIGRDLGGEEEYLLRISDRDAHDETATLNFTDYPALLCQTWRPRITVEVNHAFVAKFGLARYHKVLLNDANYFAESREDDGYHANPKRLVKTGAVESADPVGRDAAELAQRGPTVPSLRSLLRQRRFGLAMICYPVLFYRVRHFLLLMIIFKNLMERPLPDNVRLIWEYVVFRLKQPWTAQHWRYGAWSLRKVMEQEIGGVGLDDPAMVPLRRGR